MNFDGVFTAIVTPFKDGRVDFDAFSGLIERQKKADLAGIVPCGTTGESPTLSHKEHEEVISKAVESSGGRLKVIAGTGSNSTEEAISLTRHAEKIGADAVLLVNPYYNKPTQEGLYQHFSAIADNTALECVLYNIPGRTAVNCLPETIARLNEKKNVNAIKEATGDMNQASEIRELCLDKISILSGDDSLTLPLISIGGRGVISVLSNLVPEKMKELVDAALSGDFSKAQDLHRELFPLMRSMFLETNPIPIKAALSLVGLITNELRLPMTEITPGNLSSLREVLKEEGLLQ